MNEWLAASLVLTVGFVPYALVCIRADLGSSVAAFERREHARGRAGEVLDKTPAVMFVPTVLLLLGAAGVGVWFGFADLAATAAHAFVDFPAYRDAVFRAVSHASSASSSSPEWFDYLYCGGATVLAILIAAFALWAAGGSSTRAYGP